MRSVLGCHIVYIILRLLAPSLFTNIYILLFVRNENDGDQDRHLGRHTGFKDSKVKQSIG